MSKLANGLLSSLLNTGEAFASTVSAINADGLGIYDDGGNLGVFVKDGGHVGIGTPVPSAKLSIVNGFYADNILRVDATDNDAEFFSVGVKSGYIMLTAGHVGTGDNEMVFRTSSVNEAEVMRLDKEGNLGLGVVPEAWQADFTALQIGGLGAIWNTTPPSAGSTMRMSQNAYHDGSYKRIIEDEAVLYNQVNGSHWFLTAASDVADSTISWINALVINKEGNVIIKNRLINEGCVINNVTRVSTSTYTTLVTDGFISVEYTDTGTATVTLCSAAAVLQGFTLTIKDADLNASNNNITINTEGSETIDEAASTTISTNGGAINVTAVNGHWLTH